jgi:SAM-dependent methyltransferase
VLELGSGHCLFINRVKARRKVALDANPDTASYADQDIEFFLRNASETRDLAASQFDVIFSSNFFEHLTDRHQLLDVVAEATRLLRSGGLLITLMPNIDAVKWRFWDFVDHTLPLNTNSLTELMQLNDLKVEYAASRFIPYTAEGRGLFLPKPVWRPAARAYIRIRPLWLMFGKQMFVVARKSAVMSAAARSNSKKG